MPSCSFIKIIGHALFFAKQLKMPSTKGTGSDSFNAGWKQPKGKNEEDCYDKGLKPEEKVPAPPELIPPFFMPQDMKNKLHWDTCNQRGKDFKKLHDDMLDAVGFSVDMWRLQAKFKDLMVNALTALGTPGCLDGPELESNIKNAPMVAAYTGNWQKWRDAVAKGVSKCFKDWQGQVMVPGLPWYPAFVAFPGPTAPPMPNVPMPLITCVSPMMTKIIMPTDMKKEMIDALDSGLKDKDPDKHHEALFESIATVLSIAFVIWLASQQVMLVMGKGPIPTFAPPYMPVGPVVMGDNIGAPGHLIA
jgi:hypothetical protein